MSTNPNLVPAEGQRTLPPNSPCPRIRSPLRKPTMPLQNDLLSQINLLEGQAICSKDRHRRILKRTNPEEDRHRRIPKNLQKQALQNPGSITLIAFFTFGGRSVGGRSVGGTGVRRSVGGTGMGTQRGGWHRGQTPEPTGVSSNGVSSNGGWHRDRKPLTICRLVIGIPRAVMDAHSGGRTWWVAPGAAQDRHCNQHADELVPGGRARWVAPAKVAHSGWHQGLPASGGWHRSLHSVGGTTICPGQALQPARRRARARSVAPAKVAHSGWHQGLPASGGWHRSLHGGWHRSLHSVGGTWVCPGQALQPARRQARARSVAPAYGALAVGGWHLNRPA